MCFYFFPYKILLCVFTITYNSFSCLIFGVPQDLEELCRNWHDTDHGQPFPSHPLYQHARSLSVYCLALENVHYMQNHPSIFLYSIQNKLECSNNTPS